jgi:hypothetical protein
MYQPILRGKREDARNKKQDERDRERIELQREGIGLQRDQMAQDADQRERDRIIRRQEAANTRDYQNRMLERGSYTTLGQDADGNAVVLDATTGKPVTLSGVSIRNAEDNRIAATTRIIEQATPRNANETPEAYRQRIAQKTLETLSDRTGSIRREVIDSAARAADRVRREGGSEAEADTAYETTYRRGMAAISSNPTTPTRPPLPPQAQNTYNALMASNMDPAEKKKKVDELYQRVEAGGFK